MTDNLECPICGRFILISSPIRHGPGETDPMFDHLDSEHPEMEMVR